MRYGRENNQRGKDAEKIIKALMERRGYICEKGLQTDLVCNKDFNRIYVEVKSKLDSTETKFKRFFQLTSRRQEAFLKKIYNSTMQFKLFIVWFPSLTITEYDKKELDLRFYRTRLGYIRVKKKVRDTQVGI